MLLSIITPTHKVDYLSRAYQSLKLQTLQEDWEWVLVPNNQAVISPDLYEHDPRVRVIPFTEAPVGIGELKHFACSQANGDYYVELDHDDELSYECLERLKSTILEHPEADFIYSDAAGINPDGSPHLFSTEYGWEHYSQMVNGQQCLINRSFPLGPAALSSILFAPDHVRVFKATSYKALGGHDRRLAITDDYELILRWYAAGAIFHHIPETLYLYHYLPSTDNSHSKHYDDNFKNVRRLQLEYRDAILLSFCKRNELLALDLGAAHNKPEGFKGIDLYEADSVDYVMDVTLGLDFPDHSVGVIRCVDFLEHLKPEAIIPFMNECYRVLAHGGYLITSTPAFPSSAAVADPTHVSYWTSMSFEYYCTLDKSRYIPDYKGQFRLVKLEESGDDRIRYVHADMICDKHERLPGTDYILDYYRHYPFTRIPGYQPLSFVQKIAIS